MLLNLIRYIFHYSIHLNITHYLLSNFVFAIKVLKIADKDRI